MNKLQRLWRGDIALADAFWNWAVIGGLIVNLTSSGLFLWLLTVERPVLAFLAGYALSIPYNIIVAAGVWRAADRHTGDRRWAEAARIITLSAMILLSVT